MHGYELRKRLNLMLGWGRVLSYGSLYPALKKMLRAQLIEETASTTTTVTRRPRIVYQLTDAGLREFERLMSEVGPTAWEDDNFDIRFAFFTRTDMEIRLRVLEGRRSRLQERLDRVQGQLAMTQKEVDRYAVELQRHGVESVEREVRWLSELINAERATGSPAHDRGHHHQPSTSTTDQQHDQHRQRHELRRDPVVSSSQSGQGRKTLMGSVRVAIVGVGNCATSLIQGVALLPGRRPGRHRPGTHARRPSATTTSTTSSSSRRSTSTTRRSARTSPRPSTPPRTTRSRSATSRPRRRRSSAATPSTGWASTTGDHRGVRRPSRSTSSQVLREREVDVLVSYLPVGSEEADKFYAQCAIDAGVAFVNALPVFIASDPEWAKKFEDAGVPIIGDDIKSQVGATITHRVMAKLFEDRGVVLDRTYQLNVGGNMDFKNMLERERLESKKISKTQAVTSNLTARDRVGADDRNVHIGPSDYVAWLDDRKWAYVRLEGRAFGDVPLNLEYKLEVWDSPNSAGIIIDAIRAAKIAKDRGIGGPVLPASPT